MCQKNAICSIYIYTHLCLKSLNWAIFQPFLPFFDSLPVQTQDRTVAFGAAFRE